MCPWGSWRPSAERTESSIASAVAPKPVYSAIPEVPKLADLGATQTEDDDLSEADALDSSPFPRWGDSGHTDAVNHFPTPCDRADSAGRLFSIRC